MIFSSVSPQLELAVNSSQFPVAVANVLAMTIEMNILSSWATNSRSTYSYLK